MNTGQKILVADDSLTIRKLVETVLSQEGYQILTAETGADCLAMAASHKPGLILLDYMLPDKQGTEICRQLINSPDTWEIPVLMMSSNGNAIRQLYQDLNNVADYLTKPFAPNVLKAVVGHLLQDDKSKAGGNGADTAPAAQAEAGSAAESVPKDFMDKVNRLLNLMESKPAAAPAEGAAAPTDAVAPAAPTPKAKAKPRRPRKAVAAAPLPDAVMRKFRLALQKHLRSRMGQIPDWETSRGIENPEEFFLSRLLSKDLLCDLSATLLKAAGVPASGSGALRCPVSLVPLDAVLRHLDLTHATGELHVETGEETVLACLDQGQIVLLTSNHPRNYCAGAACDFGAVPHAAISEAVRAQEEQSLPFFLSLREAGHLPEGVNLDDLLRAQGEKCLSRAFTAAEPVVSFYPLTRLPAMVRAAKVGVPLNQLLLVCYRTVDDWFTLEKAFPDLEATLVPTPEMDALLPGLTLNPDESAILTAIRSGRTVAELVESSGLKQFEVCRVLFRFLKLGLIRHGARRSNDDRVDEELLSPAPQPPPATAESPQPADPSPAPDAAEAAPTIPAPADAAQTPATTEAAENKAAPEPVAVIPPEAPAPTTSTSGSEAAPEPTSAEPEAPALSARSEEISDETPAAAAEIPSAEQALSTP